MRASQPCNKPRTLLRTCGRVRIHFKESARARALCPLHKRDCRRPIGVRMHSTQPWLASRPVSTSAVPGYCSIAQCRSPALGTRSCRWPALGRSPSGCTRSGSNLLAEGPWVPPACAGCTGSRGLHLVGAGTHKLVLQRTTGAHSDAVARNRKASLATQHACVACTPCHPPLNLLPVLPTWAAVTRLEGKGCGSAVGEAAGSRRDDCGRVSRVGLAWTRLICCCVASLAEPGGPLRQAMLSTLVAGPCSHLGRPQTAQRGEGRQDAPACHCREKQAHGHAPRHSSARHTVGGVGCSLLHLDVHAACAVTAAAAAPPGHLKLPCTTSA